MICLLFRQVGTSRRNKTSEASTMEPNGEAVLRLKLESDHSHIRADLRNSFRKRIQDQGESVFPMRHPYAKRLLEALAR